MLANSNNYLFFLKEDIGPLRTVVAGGCAGVTLWTLIFPSDVVKSRLQVNQCRVGTRYFFLGSILMRPHFGTDTSEVCLHILLEDFF